MKKRVTIRDIARESGYSVNCVSRTFMDAPDISAKTKARIRAIADGMGYVRNRNASSLKNGKSGIIAVVFDNLLNPFFYIMLNYAWAALSDNDYRVITLRSRWHMFDEDTAREVVSCNAEAVLSFLHPTAQAINMLNANSVPCTVIGRKTDGLCDCVVLDDYYGGQLAAREFLARGCKRPLYIGESKSLETSVMRGSGFADEFEKAGIEAKIHYLSSGGRFKYGDSFIELCEAGLEPDCVFCFNDLGAYEVMSAMERMGITGVALIGFDDLGNEIVMPGKLTSVTYDKNEFTRLALEQMFKRIAGDGGENREVLLSELGISANQVK